MAVIDVTIRVRVDFPEDLTDADLRKLEDGMRMTEVAPDIRSAVGRAVSRRYGRDLKGVSVGEIEIHCTQRAPRV